MQIEFSFWKHVGKEACEYALKQTLDYVTAKIKKIILFNSLSIEVIGKLI